MTETTKKRAELLSSLRVFDRICDAVGWTPLVRLHQAVPASDGAVFAKVEFLNPMGSVKDRLARHLISKALDEGRLHPGDTVIEASSGNTAAGLAMMAVLEGLHCRMVVRRQTSRAKLDCLRALGVELILVDGELPPEHPDSYNRRAQIEVERTPGAYFPDQHNNRENCEAHYLSTGPEIWAQMEGRIDAFVAGIGTGGTVSGVARYLKEQDPSIQVFAIDVEGSVFSRFFHTGEPGEPSPYLMEGLGDEEIIGCPEFDLIDEMLQVSDREAFLHARELARTEAILGGGSSGAALWGVRRVARQLGPDARIVTVLPDSGTRYLSTLYNDDWMQERGLLED